MAHQRAPHGHAPARCRHRRHRARAPGGLIATPLGQVGDRRPGSVIHPCPQWSACAARGTTARGAPHPRSAGVGLASASVRQSVVRIGVSLCPSLRQNRSAELSGGWRLIDRGSGRVLVAAGSVPDARRACTCAWQACKPEAMRSLDSHAAGDRSREDLAAGPIRRPRAWR